MEEEQIIAALKEMEKDAALVTNSSFRANTERWPDNKISFVDHHLAYLRLHPGLEPRHYLSNLRLMLRKKP